MIMPSGEYNMIYSLQVNIGSDNGLVPSGNKPLPEPVLTKISRRYMASLATMSFNYLNRSIYTNS